MSPENAARTEENPIWRTMVRLLYPAVHGAGLVWLISKWVELGSPKMVLSDARSYLALWLVLFFGVSYVIIDVTPTYNAFGFVLDIVEIVLVFACFVALGYVLPRTPNYTLVFVFLAIVPLVQLFWNLAVSRKPLFWFSIAAVTFCAITAFVVNYYTWFVGVGILMLYVLLVYYLVKRGAT